MLQPLTITDEYLAKILKLNEDVLAVLALIAKGQQELIEQLSKQKQDKGPRRG